MSIFIIKLQRQGKLRPRAWTAALQASALAVSPWPQRFSFILLNYNSAPPLLLRADVGQLFSSWPAFTPGGGILRISWAIALLCVVWDLQKSVMILEGSCQPWLRCWKLALCIGSIGAGSTGVLCWCWRRRRDSQDHGGTFVTLGGKASCSHPGRFWNNSLCCICTMTHSFLVSWVYFPLFCSSLLFPFHWLPSLYLSSLSFILYPLPYSFCPPFLHSLFSSDQWICIDIYNMGLRDGLKCVEGKLH